MANPNFSESQLQSAVNSALVRHCFEQYKTHILPYVVSLFDEFTAGWDTAIVAPWYPAGDQNQDGCNLFIQYKLSEMLVSPGASQWAYWSQPYYRFQIPHRTLGKNLRYKDDYHQWKSLAKLAKAGYATFYATNSTLSKMELAKHYEAGELLDRIGWLDVSDVDKNHRHVTFTATSTIFYLHSEIREVERSSIREILATLAQRYEQESLQAANRRLIAQLQELVGSDRRRQADLSKIQEAPPERAGYIHILLRSFLHTHFGCRLVWVPKLVNSL